MDRMTCPLRQAAREYGDLPALIRPDGTVSYTWLDRFVDAVAYRLRTRGVEYGEPVAMICPMRWEYPVLLWALFRLQSMVCPISPRFPMETVSAILQNTGCRAIIDPARGFVSHTPLPGLRRIPLDGLFENLAMERGGLEDEAHVPDPELAGTIILTSGSLGLPKAVVHSLSSHYFSALGSNTNIRVVPGSRWLLSLPLYHVGGLSIIFRTILGGGVMVIPPSGKSLGEALESLRITHLSLVATQLYRLLKEMTDMQAGRRLAAVLVGGGPTGADLVAGAYDRGIPVHTTYGLTEMGSQVTTTGPNEERSRLVTSGKVLDYRQVRIDDGEILVKGKTLFKGYLTPDGLSLPLDEDGWFRSGDLGEMDDEGYLTLLGRKDNMFISGGENLYPEEIEARIQRLPGVVQAVVVPVEDEEFGFRPVAFVQSQGGETMNHDDMAGYLAEVLPRFKIPVAFFDWPGAGGGGLKPDRAYLARLARKRLGKKGGL